MVPLPDAPPAPTYQDLAQLIDHHLLAPDLSEEALHAGCAQAAEYGVAAVVVRPSDADLALRSLQGSGITVAAAVGYPHGNGTTAARLYEVRDLLRRGVQEIDIMLNIGKMVSRQFAYQETELLQMMESCQKERAKLKVTLEVGYLARDLKLIGLKICKRIGADFAVTGTDLLPASNTLEQVAELKEYLGLRLQLKAAGIRDLAQALAYREAGCTRLGTATPTTVLDAWRAHLAAPSPVS